MVVSSKVASSRFTPIKESDSEYDKYYSGHPDREEIKQIFFNGGMDRSKPAELLDDGSCRLMSNVYYPRETAFPQTRPAIKTYQTGTAAPGRVTNVYVYQKSASVSYTVFSAMNAGATDQGLYYLHPTTLAKVQITAALGGTTPPTFHTFAGRLLVAMPGVKLQEWAGETATSPAPAKASGVVTVDVMPSDTETVTIGARVFTFKTARTTVGQVTIGANTGETASNLADAINTDSWDVTAAYASNYVVVTYHRTGSDGNAIVLTDGTGGDLSLSGATLSGGVSGLALDMISSYGSPSGGIVLSDKNGRVVVSGDPSYPDRIFFSAPQNAFGWASGVYGDGEYIDIGYQEGNTITAVIPFLEELMVHKAGQNREIYRVDISDSTTSNWTVTRRFHSGTSAAINQRCAVSVAELHCALDKNMFRVYTAEDTYDEIASGIDGLRVFDYIEGATSASSFIAHSPAEMYSLIMLEPGTIALIFAPGSRRWCVWSFPAHTVQAACWHESLGKMLVGCSDGLVYKLDNSDDTDQGRATPIQTEIIGKAFGSVTMAKGLVVQAAMDFQHLLVGAGTIGLINCMADDSPITLDTFAIEDVDDFLYDATGELNDATGYLYGSLYARKVTYKQGGGESIAPRILTTSGAMVLHQLVMRVGYYGRSAK